MHFIDNHISRRFQRRTSVTLPPLRIGSLPVDSTSGIKNKGKYLALTEHGTVNSGNQPTGIDHLVELGVTHVHLLPSSDYASIDETKLDDNHYNWGYDPVNYNVPDGSYATLVPSV